MNFTDRSVIAGTSRRESDGALIADARIARTGIQTYLGSEVGRDDLATVRVYRPGAEVFSADTMKSAAHRPVTNDHPKEMVSADNWKQVAVGQTGDEIKGEGIFIRVPLMVSDGATIKDIESGKRELSAGYTCDLDFSAGTTENGEQYDAIQKNIRINHVAIVRAGRAGHQVRIGDDASASAWGASPISTTDKEAITMSDALRTVVVDGLSVSTTDQGAQAIAKLQGMLNDSAAKITTLTTDHAKALADKDGVIAKKDEEIGTLKADLKKAQDAALTPAQLDTLVSERATLVGTIKAIDAKIETVGKTDAELRKAAVAAKLGDAMVKDASDAEIAGMFKAIAKDVKPNATVDTFRDAMASVTVQANDEAGSAYAKMVADMQSAHRPATVN